MASRTSQTAKEATSAEKEVATFLAADRGPAGANFEFAGSRAARGGAARRGSMFELQAIYEAAPVGLCVLSLDLRWVRINAKMAETNGIAAEAHIGRSVYELTPGIADPVAAAVRRVVETGDSFSGEIVAKRRRDPASGALGKSPTAQSEIQPGASRRSW